MHVSAIVFGVAVLLLIAAAPGTVSAAMSPPVGAAGASSASRKALEHFPEGEDLDAAIDRFQTWFAKGYGPGLGVKLAPAGEGMRMGVFTTKAYKPEEPYLAIPLDMIIGDHTIFKTPTVGPALQQMQKHMPPSMRAQYTLGLFLLHERFVAADKSFWKPYIDLIPVSHDSPAFYNARELSLLGGTLIPALAKSVSNEMNGQFEAVKRLVSPKHESVFPSWALTKDNWRWVAGILNSRMIWWDNGPHLVPMLDMINCRQGPAPHQRRVHSTKRVGAKAVTLAPWRFDKEDQVFENYGQPNPTYFLYHGFTMSPNIHDCARLPWQTVDWAKGDKEKGIAAKRRIRDISAAHRNKAQSLRLWRDDYCVSAAPGTAATSGFEDFLAVARLMVTPEGELDAVKTPEAFRRRLKSAKLERKAIRKAALAIQSQLDHFPQLPERLKRHVNAAREAAGPENIADTAAEAQLWQRAAKDGVQRWAVSEEMAALPFRDRMALTFRETQRALLHEAVEGLRAMRKKVKLPKKKSKPADGGDEL